MAMHDIVPPERSNHRPRAAVVQEAVAHVRDQVAAAMARAGRGDAPTILAITKYLDPAGIPMLYDAGVRHFGENRPHQLAERAAGGLVGSDACWEFVGRLQSRAAMGVAGACSRIHSLGSMSAARRLARLAADGHALPVLLVQANVDEDPAKGGVPAAELAAFLESLPAEIEVAGLMTMPRIAHDPEASRPAFARLRQLRDELAGAGSRHPLVELSMGTSQDYAVAVEEGATVIRLGSAMYTLP